MWSSYREATSTRVLVLRAAIFSVLTTLPVGASLAAQTYVVPKAEVRAESNSNYGLVTDPNVDSDAYGYIADVEALIGVATPRGETSIRPRLKFQEYPNVDALATNRKVTPIEGFLDLRSRYEWQRSEFDLLGRYSHQDSYSVETPSGAFDPLDPGLDDNPDSGRVRVGETRDRFQVKPTFSYAVTERVRVGAGADIQMVRYDSKSPDLRLDYDYSELDGFVTWALSPVSDFTAATFVSKYETQNNLSKTDTYGGRVGYAYRWSKSMGVEANLFYEHDEIVDSVPVQTKQSTSGWGGNVTAYRKYELTQWRFTAGRNYVPTSDARKATVDRFRLQYDRNLSERLSFKGAARYETKRDTAPTILSNDRDYARGDLSLEWRWTPAWTISGGYSYVWEDRKRAPREADNHVFFLAVGYKGLQPQR